MGLETFVYVFQVRYEDGQISFIRVRNSEDARDLAWRAAMQQAQGIRNIKSIEFSFIEV